MDPSFTNAAKHFKTSQSKTSKPLSVFIKIGGRLILGYALNGTSGQEKLLLKTLATQASQSWEMKYQILNTLRQ